MISKSLINHLCVLYIIIMLKVVHTNYTESRKISNKLTKQRNGISIDLRNIKRKGNRRIVGGEVVKIEKYPYNVMYGVNCGGALIDSKWALTALHCGYKPNITTGSSLRGHGKIYKIKHLYPHPTKLREHLYDYDILLIELETPVKINNVTTGTVKIANINKLIPGTQIIVTGWGASQFMGKNSQNLRSIRIPIIRKSKCNAIEIPFFKDSLTDRMFCAGYNFGKYDACQGDSGSPAVNLDGELVGLVSFGKGCAEADRYGVYTKVPLFIDWIRNITGLDL